MSTCLAWGLRPKLTLLRPSTMPHLGKRSAMSRIPSSVHQASLRSSSLPVQMVKVSGSNSTSPGSMPWRFTAMS